MTQIILYTAIKAPVEHCFDLSLSVDIHQQSAAHTKEKAIAGRTSGICELNDEITWKARHFGIMQKMTVKITQVDRPHSFEDRMLKGAFKSMHHIHLFEYKDGITTMKDIFTYEVPFGFIGSLFDKLVLKRHMTDFLLTRNGFLKDVAERSVLK
ncbi:MAG: cell division protein [Bacteroidetes bacterium]|nr:cell division protein [Bacteroidota bacterium]